MSNLSTAYAISEVVPFVHRWLKGANILENSNKITEIAKKVTEEETTLGIIKVLNSDVNKMSLLQIELLNSFDELEFNSNNLGSVQSKSIRGDLMVVSVSVALCVYIYALTCCKENLSGEVVGMLSTIAGIFGSCLKDAFSSEFKFLKNKEE